MASFLFKAPAGVPGSITRSDNTVVEPAMLIAVSTVYAQKYGIPMKYTTGGIQQFNGGAEVPGDFAGVLGRQVPSIAGTAGSDLTYDDAVPNPDQVQGLVVFGYVIVKCTSGTPARGGDVYIQTVASGGINVGEFRTTDDGSNAIQLTKQQATWASDGKDSDNNAELRIQL